MATLIGPSAVTGVSSRGNGSDIASFIEFLGDPSTQIPLDSDFLLVFESPTVLPNALLSPFPDGFEPRWNVNNVKKALTNIVTLGTNNAPLGGRGHMFVQSFDIPGEAVEVSRPGTLSSNSSYRSGVVSGNRVQYSATLDVGVLETNKSFLDFVIRPWIALVAHYGLYTRASDSPQNVKTNLTGILFDKNDKEGKFSSARVRKVYRFTGVAPVTMVGANYAYGKNQHRIDKVSFVYNNFSISEGISDVTPVFANTRAP